MYDLKEPFSKRLTAPAIESSMVSVLMNEQKNAIPCQGDLKAAWE
jgi:hypothetical protein